MAAETGDMFPFKPLLHTYYKKYRDYFHTSTKGISKLFENIKSIKFDDDLDTRKGPQHLRYAEGPTKDVAEANIPPEWDAWLRRTREVPPTSEELQRNYTMKMHTKQKVMELEEQYKEEHEETDNQKIASNLSTSMLKDKKRFPVYEEYEQVPGAISKGRTEN